LVATPDINGVSSIGWTLFGIGALTRIPLVLEVLGKRK
jgi:hypothetical protein